MGFAGVAALLLVTVGYAVGPMLVSRKLGDIPALGVITRGRAAGRHQHDGLSGLSL
ncbi:MAG TPA: hypothetical protein VF635_11375 [Propionibacteriaceae bacterium]